jgi:hypothetical protein
MDEITDPRLKKTIEDGDRERNARQREIVLRMIREFALQNPPEIECLCSVLPRERQLRAMRWLVRKHADDIYRNGIRSSKDLIKFLEVVDVLEKHGWICHDDCKLILDRVGELIKAYEANNDGAYDAADGALRRIAAGLGRRGLCFEMRRRSSAG